MIPVCQAGHEHALEVGHDRVERFAVFWCVRGQSGADVPRLGAGQDGVALNVFDVVGNPIDELVTVAPEVCRVHAAAS